LNKRIAVLISILLLSVIIKGFYLAEIKRIQFYDNPVGDAKNYVNRAEEIFHGKIFPEEAPFLSNAIYPYFLAGTFVISNNLTTPRIIQFILGIATIILIYLITNMLFGNIQALASAFIAGVYPVFLFFEGDLLAVTLTIFTLSLSCLMLVYYQNSSKLKYLVFAGLSIGLSALGKPDTVLLAPAIALWVLFRDKNYRDKIKPVLYFAVSVIIMILPLTISNWITEKDFIPLTSNGGVNFYIGNHKGATGIFRIPQNSGLAVDGLHRLSQKVAQYNSGRELKPSETSRYWFSKAIDFARNNPAEFISLLIKKTLLMINKFEVPNHHSYYFYKSQCNVLKYNQLNLSFLLFFGCIGIGLSLKSRRKYYLLYIFIAVTFITPVLFFVSDRYRLPVTIFYIIFSGQGIYQLCMVVAKRQRINIFPSVIVALIIVGVSLINFPVFDRSFKHDFKNLGNVNFKLKQYDKAVCYYRMVLAEYPYEPFVHANLAKTYYMKGNIDSAIQEFIAETKYNPSFSEPYIILASICEKRNDFPSAAKYLEQIPGLQNNSKALLKLASIYSKMGFADKANSIYSRIGVVPDAK